VTRAHLRLALVAASLLALAACEREARLFTTPANNSIGPASVPRLSANQPGVALQGGVQQAATDTSPYEGNAWAVSQGKRLYGWYNCNGCHAAGGGGMGPPLMDDQWVYGSRPADIHESIVRGRPNGMPSFGGHIADDQVWQLVAYVRSMSGKLRKDVAPSRTDTMYPGNPENMRPVQPRAAEGGRVR
jgi:cytochrome c oxidase cbb3-type subunit 3